MAKFIFICRRCGKKFKGYGQTLQTARMLLCLKQGGIPIGEDQGFVCSKCAKDQYDEQAAVDKGTYCLEIDLH